MSDYVKQLEDEISALKGKLVECDWKAELFDRIMDSATIEKHQLDFSKNVELSVSCDTDNRLDRTIIEIAQKATADRRKWWDKLKEVQRHSEEMKKFSKDLQDYIHGGI
jgi:hypothetical protein